MGRRAFREKRSKFYGTKQVLTDINLPAHLAIHDLDASVVQLPGGGLAGQVLTKDSNNDYDVSWSFIDLLSIDGGDASSEAGVINGGSAGTVASTSIDGGVASSVPSSTISGGVA